MFDMIPNLKNKYWFYLHPYVHLNIKNDCAVLYNTLNGKLLEYNEDYMVSRILKRLKRNLYITQLNSKDITGPLRELIKKCRNYYFGDILDSKFCKNKPFQAKPIMHLSATKNELTFKSKIKILERDEIGDYINIVNIYINNECGQNCTICDHAYKQILNCKSDTKNSKSSEELKVNDIDDFLTKAQYSSLYKLNILGGNILKYSKLENLAKIFSRFNFKIDYYVNYFNIVDDKGKKIKLLKYNPSGTIHILLNPPISINIFGKSLCIIKALEMPYIFHFILTDESDFSYARKVISSYNLNNYELEPIYTVKNKNFFENHLFITKEAIINSKPSMKNVFSRMSVNTVFFKKIFIMSNKKIYANLFQSCIGKLGIDSIFDVIKNELTLGSSWNRIRPNVIPCKSCPYNALCPPISNYEFAIGRYNLCKIWDRIKKSNHKSGSKE